MQRFTLLACSLAVGLTACGGGGGSGDGASGSVVNARSPVPPQQRLNYTGSVAAASIGDTNAAGITADVITATGAALGSSILRERTGTAVSTSIPCDSGSINISGTVNNAGTGTASVDYVDCRTGPNTLNGPAALTIRGYDQASGIVTDGTLDFTRVRFFGPGVSLDFTGTVDVQVNVSSNRLTLTQRITTQNNDSGARQTQTNLTFVNSYSTVSHPTFFNQSISGSVCDGTQGCASVSTATAPFTSPWGPLYFATSTQAFPDWGIINIDSGTTRVRVTSLGVDLAKLQVDSGSGTFGTPARLRWSELNSSLGANLADSDGDGMHDSYETFAGLNAGANDASGDADGDGFSNYTEYLAGTNAGTNGSVPSPVRHLWVTDVSGLAESGGQIAVFVNSSTNGVMLDPVTGELTSDTAAAFPAGVTPSTSGNTTVADAQGRVFTITQVGTSTSWIITSSTGATLTINNVGGTGATSLIRYGAHGLAFRTIGTASPGYIYLVESTALVP